MGIGGIEYDEDGLKFMKCGEYVLKIGSEIKKKDLNIIDE